MMLRGIFTAGLYLMLFWLCYPVALALAWVWEQWDRVQQRHHDRLWHGSWQSWQ